MSSGTKVIEVEDLRVIRGMVEVLDIPSFFLGDNEIISLIGPNGSGKSTLLLILNCLLKPINGRVIFRGREIDSNQSAFDYRRRTAMVFQEPLLFDTTVFNNVAAGLKIRGMSQLEIKTKVIACLERFNIVHLAGRSARKLSGGEAQRTSLARAVAIDPEVLFLDEPFAALDPPTRQSITDDLEKIIHQTGIAAVIVTHDESEALRLSDRIMVMNSGKIIQTGNPAEVMNHPVNQFVANFVGMESIIPGTVRNNKDGAVTVTVPGGWIEAVGERLPGEEVFCGIRPENVVIDIHDPMKSINAGNVFSAKIAAITSIGPFLKVAMDCGFSLVSYVSRGSFAKLKLAVGEDVLASFKATAVHLISRKN